MTLAAKEAPRVTEKARCGLELSNRAWSVSQFLITRRNTCGKHTSTIRGGRTTRESLAPNWPWGSLHKTWGPSGDFCDSQGTQAPRNGLSADHVARGFGSQWHRNQILRNLAPHQPPKLTVGVVVATLKDTESEGKARPNSVPRSGGQDLRIVQSIRSRFSR